MCAGDVELVAGESHSMLLKQDTSLWSCGLNSDHQLGIESSVHHSTNFVQAISSGVKCMAAGLSHSILLKYDDTVWATGANKSGQLGNGLEKEKETKYVPVFTDAIAIAAGGYHSMVLKKDDTVWATGGNHHGQLGDVNKNNKSTYAEVFGTWTLISSAYSQSHVRTYTHPFCHST